MGFQLVAEAMFMANIVESFTLVPGVFQGLLGAIGEAGGAFLLYTCMGREGFGGGEREGGVQVHET